MMCLHKIEGETLGNRKEDERVVHRHRYSRQLQVCADALRGLQRSIVPPPSAEGYGYRSQAQPE